MISRCSGYHAGFNFGFNIAEAVNFALSDWLKIANQVESCRCVNDSVRFDMGSFFQNIRNSDQFKSLFKKQPSTRRSAQSFDHTHRKTRLLSQSESLHSFKSTPTRRLHHPHQLKVGSLTPTRTVQNSQPVEIPPLLAPSQTTDTGRKQPVVGEFQVKDNKNKSVYRQCEKCKKVRKICEYKRVILQPGTIFECKLLNDTRLKCQTGIEARPI